MSSIPLSLTRRLAAKAKTAGKGVAVKEGNFIGPPILKMTEKILAKQKQISR